MEQGKESDQGGVADGEVLWKDHNFHSQFCAAQER